MKKKKEIKKEEVKEIEKKVVETQKKNNRILGGIVLVVAVLFVFFVAFSITKDSETTFSHRGIDFQIVDEIAPYKTTVIILKEPSQVTGALTKIPFHLYMRNDPRDLEKEVPFNGELILMQNLVLASGENEFNCEGMGIVGVTNMARFYDGIGIKVIRDENTTCDPAGRYIYMNLIESDETKIQQIGPVCYTMHISNCEILKTTERFMLEGFVKYKELDE